MKKLIIGALSIVAINAQTNLITKSSTLLWDNNPPEEYVTHYRVYLSSGAKTNILTVTTNRAPLAPLLTNITGEVSITVSAVNLAGEGGQSAPFRAFSLALPSDAVNLSITNNGVVNIYIQR
jgi:hypothetical protein